MAILFLVEHANGKNLQSLISIYNYRILFSDAVHIGEIDIPLDSKVYNIPAPSFWSFHIQREDVLGRGSVTVAESCILLCVPLL